MYRPLGPNWYLTANLYRVHVNNIYNGTVFPSFNHAKVFDSIPDETRSTSGRELLGKSHAQ